MELDAVGVQPGMAVASTDTWVWSRTTPEWDPVVVKISTVPSRLVLRIVAMNGTVVFWEAAEAITMAMSVQAGTLNVLE